MQQYPQSSPPQQTRAFSLILQAVGVLLRGKRFLFWFTAVPTVFAIAAVLLVKSEYKAEAAVNAPRGESSGSLLGALGAPPGMGGLFGSLLGGGNAALDDCYGILGSTLFARQVIERFDLETHYEFKREGKNKKYRFADVLRVFRENMAFSVNDEDVILISMRHESPETAKEIVDYMVFLLDSLYTGMQRTSSLRQLEFAKNRLEIARADMRAVEDSLVDFQKRRNLLAPEAQIRMILENVTQTELRLRMIDEEMIMEEALRGSSSATYRDLRVQKGILTRLLEQRMRAPIDTASLLFPTQALPEVVTEYFRLERAYAVQLGVFKYLVQQVEALELDAARNIQVLTVLDPAWANDKRVSPKRRVVVQATFTLAFIAGVLLLFLLDAWRRYRAVNPESRELTEALKRSASFRKRV